MPINSAVGLFCCDKFEETLNEKVVNMSKLTKFYFREGQGWKKNKARNWCLLKVPFHKFCINISLYQWNDSYYINSYWSYYEFCMADLNGMQKWLSVGDHIMVNVYNYFDRYSYMQMYEYSIGFFYQIWWSRFETQINTPTKTSVYINKEGRF